MKPVTDTTYVSQSRFWQTNGGVIVQDNRAILIDAGVFPDELANLAEQLRHQTIVAGLSTHEDWDHVLWSEDLGVNVPRFANPVACRIATDHRADLLGQINAEEESYGVRWNHDLVGRLQPVAFGETAIGSFSLELHHLPGHTEGNAGFWLPASHVAFTGDTLSDIDPPVLAANRTVAMLYPETLDRLRDLITPVDVIIPGHGRVCERSEAMRRLELDFRYLNIVFNATIGNSSGDPSSPGKRPPRLTTPACRHKSDGRCMSRTSPACSGTRTRRNDGGSFVSSDTHSLPSWHTVDSPAPSTRSR